MTSLDEHIKTLRTLDEIDPTTAAICQYILNVYKEHHVDSDNTHTGINGKDGFVDSLGSRMTEAEFFKAITSPEPQREQTLILIERGRKYAPSLPALQSAPSQRPDDTAHKKVPEVRS